MGKEQFSYQITKISKLFVHWHGRQSKREIVLKGPRAEKLIRELPAMVLDSNVATSVRSVRVIYKGKLNLSADSVSTPAVRFLPYAELLTGRVAKPAGVLKCWQAEAKPERAHCWLP
jgi:hypothetical protein